jgi:branched-chain amino acid transport system substrate-binding protein
MAASWALAAALLTPPWARAQTGVATMPDAGPIRIAMIEGVSGAFANAGEAVQRNLQWAIERVNAAGGVATADGRRPLELVVLDSKGNVDEALAQLRQAADQNIRFIAQGNSSAIALQLVDAIDKHNAREPGRRMLLLNYSAVEPSLTRERCSYWHFRFDAHADMRMHALTEVLARDSSVNRVALIGQDYSFGQAVLREARRQLAAKRPDIAIVAEELHPLGRVKDFAPYAAKIKASQAQAIITGNWGNDLTLLVRAAREAGFDGKFYTFYGNALGVPAAIGAAGVGRVIAVAEWHPNVGDAASQAYVAAFRSRFPKPEHDYQHARMDAMIQMLARAIERAGTLEAAAVARELEGARLERGFHRVVMRAADHQALQDLVVSVMQPVGSPGVRYDNEGSGYGFATLARIAAERFDDEGGCRMQRPVLSP